jgi:hypothetical protein
VKLPRRRYLRGSAFHAGATVVWALLTVPTVLWWRESVFWVALISVWANVVSHASAYEAARAKEIAVSAESGD